MSFTWSGREMIACEWTEEGTNDEMRAEFLYDENGSRHSKLEYRNDTLESKYDYVWLNDKLISQSCTDYSNGIAVENNTAKFIYDSTDELLGFIHNDTNMYLFTKNIYGDITSIVNSQGQSVVEYKYDAWGAVKSTTTSNAFSLLSIQLSKVSSFAYRGYCYDEGMKLYYLHSRYYSPAIGRFINTDDTQIAIITQGDILGANLFAYCRNNPILFTDEDGYIAGIGYVIIIVIVVIVVLLPIIISGVVKWIKTKKEKREQRIKNIR
jgi:RHS repeat-associated protein